MRNDEFKTILDLAMTIRKEKNIIEMLNWLDELDGYRYHYIGGELFKYDVDKFIPTTVQSLTNGEFYDAMYTVFKSDYGKDIYLKLIIYRENGKQ